MTDVFEFQTRFIYNNEVVDRWIMQIPKVGDVIKPMTMVGKSFVVTKVTGKKRIAATIEPVPTEKTIRLIVDGEEIGEQDRSIDAYPNFPGDVFHIPDPDQPAWEVFNVDYNGDMYARPYTGDDDDVAPSTVNFPF